MSEQEPAEDEKLIMIGEHEFLVTRRNTKLYTFFGSIATRNHVFINTGEDQEDVQYGSYVFAHDEAWGFLTRFIIDHEFPMALNALDVLPWDEEAFQRSIEGLTIESDYFPEEWEGGQ